MATLGDLYEWDNLFVYNENSVILASKAMRHFAEQGFDVEREILLYFAKKKGFLRYKGNNAYVIHNSPKWGSLPKDLGKKENQRGRKAKRDEIVVKKNSPRKSSRSPAKSRSRSRSKSIDVSKMKYDPEIQKEIQSIKMDRELNKRSREHRSTSRSKDKINEWLN